MATGALEESKAGKGDRECWGEPLGNSGGQRAAGDLSDPGEEGGRAAELEREVAA